MLGKGGRLHTLAAMQRISVIDSHTGGEPTRLVVAGGPDLGSGTMADRRELFRTKFDHFRSAIVNEPRGSDVFVGVLLCEPSDTSCAAGVIFFNNVGPLGMCGHGTIGLVVTLAHMGRIKPGIHRIDTPVGVVAATLHDDGSVSVQNVPSYRQQKDVVVTLADGRKFTGDVAWGGNWFYLVDSQGLDLSLANVEALTDLAWKVRVAVNSSGFPEVDHVEFFGPPTLPGSHSRNFVLCPGKAYDRSPCGTGTSAKLACLFADGKIKEGDVWRQEGIVGSWFDGTVAMQGRELVPTIRGSAHICAESTLLLDDRDPFRFGIRAG